MSRIDREPAGLGGRPGVGSTQVVAAGHLCGRPDDREGYAGHRAGYDEWMADTDDNRRAERADELLPEERAAGSDDPAAQAAAILADSDRRADTREDDPGDQEHRAGPPGT